MDNLEHTKSDDLESLNNSVYKKSLFQRMSSIFYRCMIFFFIVIVIVGLGIGIWLRKFYGPMDIENADTAKLNGWLLLRDFSKETPEIRRQLLLRYLDFYGPDASKPAYHELVGATKSVTRFFFQKRQNRLEEWEKTRMERPCIRYEYRIIRPSNQEKFDLSPTKKEPFYIIPADIEPTDLLKEALKEENRKHAMQATIRMELNCRYLAREWFLWKMDEYEKTPDAQKTNFLLKITDEFNWWQEFYQNSIVQMGLPRIKLLDVLREFDLTVSWWYENTNDVNELARLLWFKDLLITVTMARQAKLPFNAPVQRREEDIKNLRKYACIFKRVNYQDRKAPKK